MESMYWPCHVLFGATMFKSMIMSNKYEYGQTTKNTVIVTRVGYNGSQSWPALPTKQVLSREFRDVDSLCNMCHIP